MKTFKVIRILFAAFTALGIISGYAFGEDIDGLVVDSFGNLGIGESDPQYKLHAITAKLRWIFIIY